jgi:predicted secreted protein
MSDVEVRADGSAVTLGVSDAVTIRVPENGGTGYQWSVVDVPAAMTVESTSLALPDEVRPGAAAERVFVLRAQAAGSGRVVLSLARVFEPHPVETFSVDVEIKEP